MTEEIEKKGKIIKVIKTIIKILIVVILLCLATDIFYQKIIKREKNINFFGYKIFTVMSNSMQPVFQEGDLIIDKVIDKDRIELNDIVTFSNANISITHRVVDIQEEEGITYFYTKGDRNNEDSIEKVTYEEIEGILKFRIRLIGYLFMLNTKGIIFLVIVLIILIYLFTINRKKILLK